MEQIETSDNPKLTLERLLVSRDLPCAMRSMQQESKSIHLNTFNTDISYHVIYIVMNSSTL